MRTTSGKKIHLKHWPGSPTREENPNSQDVAPFSEYAPNAKDEIAAIWMGGELEFSIARKGKVLFSQHAGRPANDVESFINQLKEFTATIAFKGKNLFVLSENNVVKTLTETLPPVSLSEQKQYVRGKIRRLEQEVGPILWDSEAIESAHPAQRKLLHTVAKTALDELARGVSKLGYNLERLVPLSTVASQSLFTRKGIKGTPTLISTTIAGARKLLASNDRSELIFTRGLKDEVSNSDRKISTEINRCLLFAKQQYGLDIAKLQLDSSSSDSLDEAIQDTCGDQIEITKKDLGKEFWHQALASCKTGNLLLLNEARSHSQIALSIIAGCVYLLLAYMAYDSFLDSHDEMTRTTLRIENLKHSSPLLQSNLDRANELIKQTSHDTALIDASADFSKPPINLALIQFLGQRLPEKMRISELGTNWSETESCWEFSLQLKSSYSKPQTSLYGRQLRDLLKEPPFAAEIVTSLFDSNNVVSVSSGGTASQEHTYNINGRIHHGQ